MPDREILTLARRGDETAIAELYRRNVDSATRYAQSIVANPSDAEDLVAESFTLVITQLRAGRGPETSFRAYLFTTMRHRVYSSSRREVSVADASMLDRATDVPDTDSKTNGELVLAGFNTLSGADQEILLMLDIHELRPAEVGSKLGLRPSAVSMRAARAREALAEAYLVAHTRAGDDKACERVRCKYGRYVRGRLSAGCALRVKAHLDTCPRCTATMVELADVNRALRGLPIFAGIESGKHGATWLLTASHGGPGVIATKIGLLAASVGAVTTAGIVIAVGAHHANQPAPAVPLRTAGITSSHVAAAPPAQRTVEIAVTPVAPSTANVQSPTRSQTSEPNLTSGPASLTLPILLSVPVSISQVSIPTVAMPTVAMPTVAMPTLAMPSISAPDLPLLTKSKSVPVLPVASWLPGSHRASRGSP